MSKRMAGLISVAMLLGIAGTSWGQIVSDPCTQAIQDTIVTNDSKSGPDSTHGGSSTLDPRDFDDGSGTTRKRVGYLRFDISGFKSEGTMFTNVALSNV